MKLIYLADMRMPTEKAHGIHVANMCEAFGRIGVDTTLIAPYVTNNETDNVFEYYGLTDSFKVERVPTINIGRYLPVAGHWLRLVTFPLAAATKLLFVSRADLYIHTRDYFVAFIFKLLGFKVSYEAHRVLSKKATLFWLLKGIPNIVTNSEGVAKEFRAAGFKNVMPRRHGVDPRRFADVERSDAARTKLGLPVGKKIVMYTGALYAWKGIDELVRAAQMLQSSTDIEFVLLGGSDHDVDELRARLEREGIGNVLLCGHIDYKKIPAYIANADVLVLPNNTSTVESVTYTSPTKLPDYMISRVPIIATDMPSIRQVLSEKNAVLVPPDNPEALHRSIDEVSHNPEKFQSQVQQAYDDALAYTWKDRAQDIVDFVNPVEEV